MTSMPTSQCKEKKQEKEGREGDKNKIKDGLFKTKQNKKPFDFLTLKYHTLGNKYIVSIKKLPFFHAVCAC